MGEITTRPSFEIVDFVVISERYSYPIEVGLFVNGVFSFFVFNVSSRKPRAGVWGGFRGNNSDGPVAFLNRSVRAIFLGGAAFRKKYTWPNWKSSVAGRQFV